MQLRLEIVDPGPVFAQAWEDSHTTTSPARDLCLKCRGANCLEQMSERQ